MKRLGELLKSVYEKKSETYDEIERINIFLKKHHGTLSPTLQNLLDRRTGISYKNNILTIFVPRGLFSPETHFAAHELKEFFLKESEKKLRAVRFAPEQQ
ncbi:MAG: hypothetical protein Q7S09_00680 [bacterium]|nr:hypothetical protein [bacterium]